MHILSNLLAIKILEFSCIFRVFIFRSMKSNLLVEYFCFKFI